MTEFGHLAGFLDSLGLGPVRFVFMALFIACALFAIWKRHPLSEKECVYGAKGEKWVLLARPAMLIAVCAMLIFLNFAHVPETAYAISGETIAQSETDLSKESYTSEPFTFETAASLTEFSMPITAKDVNRTSRSMIHFALTEHETGKTLWEDVIGTAELIGKTQIRLPIENVCVYENTLCQIKIEGEFSERFPDGYVYPFETNNGEIVFSLR